MSDVDLQMPADTLLRRTRHHRPPLFQFGYEAIRIAYLPSVGTQMIAGISTVCVMYDVSALPHPQEQASTSVRHPMPSAYIAIGSNVGDRAGHVAFARRALAALPKTRLAAVSTVHETEPVGPVAMDPFLNAVARIETELEPLDLLHRLHAIEQRAGRVRSIRWGPRTLDLDLLLYGERVVHTPQLTIPHPHLHERRFVLEPLAELAPTLRHPETGETIADLLEAI